MIAQMSFLIDPKFRHEMTLFTYSHALYCNRTTLSRFLDYNRLHVCVNKTGEDYVCVVGVVLILVIVLILISCLWCFYTNKSSFFCFFLCYFFLFLSPDFQQFLFPLKLFPLPFQLFRIIFFLMQNIQQTKVIEELQDLGTA